MRQITIVNQSPLVSPADLAAAVAALQIQVARDFAQAWGISCQLQASTDPKAPGEKIFLLDTSDQVGALGYHELGNDHAPVGFVFVKTTLAAGDRWQATLSHELLEQLLDPDANVAAVVVFKGRQTAMAYEACDAVENDEYQINGVPVSNFLLPGWFVPGFAGKVDFMGTLKAPLTLSRGGYVAYTRDLRSWQQIFAEHTPDHQRKTEPFSRRHRRFQNLKKRK